MARENGWAMEKVGWTFEEVIETLESQKECLDRDCDLRCARCDLFRTKEEVENALECGITSIKLAKKLTKWRGY